MDDVGRRRAFIAWSPDGRSVQPFEKVNDEVLDLLQLISKFSFSSSRHIW
jgi:hypothetical protein